MRRGTVRSDQTDRNRLDEITSNQIITRESTPGPQEDPLSQGLEGRSQGRARVLEQDTDPSWFGISANSISEHEERDKSVLACYSPKVQPSQPVTPAATSIRQVRCQQVWEGSQKDTRP